MYQNPHGLVGQTIDTYKIEEILGFGGMGVVYRAENIKLESKVALKIVAPQLVEKDTFVNRFEHEARVLARLRHPNIVQVYDLRHAGNLLYFVMELVEGETLEWKLTREGHIPWRESLDLAKQLLNALQFAHDAKIIHRDIKPGNIMINLQGRIKVLDFGLAKLLREGSASGNSTIADLKRQQQRPASITQLGAGTPKYTSPEQARGAAKIDHRVDIFSMGMTFYEALTGALPFDKTDSIYTIQRKIIEEDFKPIQDINPNVPAALADIFMKAIEKQPERRFASANEMLYQIEAFEREVIKAELRAIPTGQHLREGRTPWQEDTVLLHRMPELETLSAERSGDEHRREFGAIVALVLAVVGVIWSLLFWYPGLLTSKGEIGDTDPPREEILTPAGPVGSIRVLSNPSGAAIWVDGYRRGRTPETIENWPIGEEVLIVLQMEGYAADSARIVLNEESARHSRVLQPMAGTLAITVGPAPARLIVDGQLYDGGRPARSFSLDMVGGHHYIRIESQDGAWEDQIFVEPSLETPLSIDFQSSASVLVEAFDVTGNPVAGQIYIDGEIREGFRTPAELRVPVGVHTFEVRAQGYSYVLKANVAAAANGPLAIQLRR